MYLSTMNQEKSNHTKIIFSSAVYITILLVYGNPKEAIPKF